MLNTKELRALSCKLKSEPEDYMHSFRRNISLYIDRKEITLQEVAELADISLSTLKSFLYGDSKDCTLSTTIKLAKVFNVSMDELVGAGTISPQTCKSLQTMRLLPESFTHFVRWCIQFHYENLKNHNIESRAVEVMQPFTADDGNLKMTNQMEIVDISNLSDDLKPKIFMGIRIPSDAYAPHFFEGDILLLANDRAPKNNERIIFSTGDNMWIVEKRLSGKECKYHYIRSGRVCAEDCDITNIMGYVAKVLRDYE